MYETLMSRKIVGGDILAIAGRLLLAGQAGMSRTALDDARRETEKTNPPKPDTSSAVDARILNQGDGILAKRASVT